MTARMLLMTVLALAAATSARAQPPADALPAILHLQPDQHPAWRAYKDALALGRADSAHDMAEAARLNGLTTPERLDALRADLRSRDAAFERQARATQAFYAALSPDQKRVFDQVTRTPTPPAPLHAYPTGARFDPKGADSEGPAPTSLKVPPAGSALPPPAG